MEAVDALWKLSSLRRMIASALELVLTDLSQDTSTVCFTAAPAH